MEGCAMEIHIELNEYEIANLIQAMKMVPRTGAWYAAIISKIQTAVEDTGITIESFEGHANIMTPKNVRNHLDIMDLKERHSF